MTKEQFRAIALKMVDEICELPDSIWNATRPMGRSTFVFNTGERITVVVGMECPNEGDA
jgi:hypothetical protein